ncbi:MAG: tetratricopeptide repeat protein [Cyanobacteria bacterium P01_D01_bin.44]
MSYQQVLQDIQAGRFEAAIAQLDRLLKADPAQSELWQAKATALLSSDQPEAAVVAIEQAIRLNPQLAAAHRLLGKAYAQLGDTQGAVAGYKQAARCYLDQQDKARAQACLGQIKQLRPAPPPSKTALPQPALGQPLISSNSFLEQVATKRQQGQYGEALEDLNWLLQFESDNVKALAQRALLRAKLHNRQAAVQDMARAIALAPDEPTLRLQRGQMRLSLGDAQGAIADLTPLLQVKAINPVEVYTLRGQAHQQLKDTDSAFKDFSNALGIDPQNADCYKARGGVYETMGNLEEALADYRQAATRYLDQGDWFAHQSLQRQIENLQPDLQAQKDEAARIIRVPIKYLIGNTPIIEVIFNSRCAFDMVLDTGASVTQITQTMANLLNVVPTGTKRFRVADGWLVENPVGFVHSVAIDRAQVDNLEVAICSTSSEGLLGQNFLWRYDVRILRTEVELYMR